MSARLGGRFFGLLSVLRLAGIWTQYALSLIKHTSISPIAKRQIVGDSIPGEKTHVWQEVV